jgi:hypothetical protein
MSSGMASGIAVSCLGAMIGRNSFSAWSGTVGKIKLMSSSASDGVDGTEISGGSYPAGGISLGTISTTFGAAGYAGGVASCTNSGAAVTQTSMPAVGGGGIVSASLYDNGPVRWWWGDLTTAVVTNSGDTLTFATSSITVQLNV